MAASQFTVPTVFTAINKFSGPVQGMMRTVNAFGTKSANSIGMIERAFRGLFSPLRSLNSIFATFGVGIGLYSLVAVMRSGIGVIADFEEAQIAISAVSHRSVQENKDLAKQARQMAVDYGMAATSVSKLQLELIKMGFAEKEGGMKNILAMTPSIVLGAKAMNAPESELANIVGASMNLFKLPANDVVDLFAKGLDISAMNFESFSHMIRNSQQAWALSGKKLPDLIANLGILSNAYVHAASAGTGVKNITIDNAVAMKDMNTQLMKIANSKNPLATGKKMFGRKAVLSAFPMAAAIADGSFASMLKKLNTTSTGYAKALAEIKQASINAKFAQAKTAWQEMILSIDDGTGKFSNTIRKSIDVFRAMNLIASGSDIAKNALLKMNPEIVKTAESWLMWSRIIIKIVKWIAILYVVMLAWRAAVLIATAATVAYNFVAGLMFALTGAQTAAFITSASAIGAYTLATKIATGAQWLWNAAMTANPIGLIIIAVGALIGLISLVIVKWNEWGAAVSFFMGPLGFVISLIQSFRRNWDMVVKAFTSEGIISGLKKIGLVIIDAMLMPIQQIYKIMSNIPGTIGTSSAKMVQMIDLFRTKMGVNTTTDENGHPLQNPKAIAQESFMETVKKENKNITVDFFNVPEWAKIGGDKDSIGSIKPIIESTFK